MARDLGRGEINVVEFHAVEKAMCHGGREGIASPDGVDDGNETRVALGELTVTKQQAAARTERQRHDPQFKTHRKRGDLRANIPRETEHRCEHG